jgi:predicted NAD-dependent protein-ADP-ribosyltransferase YbiA (DUF1768 family)
MALIDSFIYEYYFLSNGYPCSVFLRDEEEEEALPYPSVSHAYYASKLTGENVKWRDHVMLADTSEEARRIAKDHSPHPWVYTVQSQNVMRDLLNQKFKRWSDLWRRLLATSPAIIVHVKYRLGEFLMELRASESHPKGLEPYLDTDDTDHYHPVSASSLLRENIYEPTPELFASPFEFGHMKTPPLCFVYQDFLDGLHEIPQYGRRNRGRGRTWRTFPRRNSLKDKLER